MTNQLSFKSGDFVAYYNKMCQQRVRIMRFAAESKENRAVIYKQVAADPLFFINNFIITYNPREKIKVIPMVMFPRQEEMLLFIQDCYEKGSWGTITKCRYTGASVVCTAFMLHKLMFEPAFSGSLSSNKADSVDKLGDPDSLFGKLDSMYEWLPPWLKPFDWSQNRKIKLIQNPVTGGTIKGYSGDNIGRGGRSSLAIIDESAHIERDVNAIAAMSENTDCAILVTTPNGKNNEHYRLHMSPEVKSFMFQWQDDPRRDAAWAEAQKLKLGDDMFARELGCSFDTADGKSFIPLSMVESIIGADIKSTAYGSAFGSTSDRILGLDLAKTGDKNILCLRDGNTVVHLENLGHGEVDETIHKVLAFWQEHKFQKLVYDATGLGDTFKTIMQLVEPNYEGMFELTGYKGAGSSKSWDDNSNATNDKVTYNLRAVSWRDMKRRIEKTSNIATGRIPAEAVDPEELIIIPNHRELIEDLAAPSCEFRGNKLLIESKESMRERGLKSTDWADALMYSFYTGSGYEGSL